MLILASNSPRRKELLRDLGLFFYVITSEIDENIDENRPIHLVEKLAILKAEKIAEEYPDDIIIGADTIVVLDGDILGKPKDDDDARKILQNLSGKSHEVFTGVSIICKNRKYKSVFYERTEVEFFELNIDDINRYILTREPFDKAGAYGIQGLGKLFVKGITGDYFNVVGLPIARLAKELNNSEIAPLINTRSNSLEKEGNMLIISNAFDGSEVPHSGQKVYKEVSQEGSFITLDSGVVLELVYGGKLFDKVTNEKYAAVYEAEDEDSIGSLFGYIKVRDDF